MRYVGLPYQPPRDFVCPDCQATYKHDGGYSHALFACHANLFRLKPAEVKA